MVTCLRSAWHFWQSELSKANGLQQKSSCTFMIITGYSDGLFLTNYNNYCKINHVHQMRSPTWKLCGNVVLLCVPHGFKQPLVGWSVASWLKKSLQRSRFRPCNRQLQCRFSHNHCHSGIMIIANFLVMVFWKPSLFLPQIYVQHVIFWVCRLDLFSSNVILTSLFEPPSTLPFTTTVRRLHLSIYCFL